MGKVKFDKGVEANLPTTDMVEEGHVYVTEDNGNVYLGKNDGTLVPFNRCPYYGTCQTAAGTAAKTVQSLSDGARFFLKAGVTVIVKFDKANTAASPTLNVCSTGAVGIKEYGTTAIGSSASLAWRAGEAVLFLYDGSNWLRLSHLMDIVQPDWASSTAPAAVLNKPALESGTGTNSIKESNATSASGNYSHAEGTSTLASGEGAHAEGNLTKALSSSAHAEGTGAETALTVSGNNTVASPYTTSTAHGLKPGNVVRLGTSATYTFVNVVLSDTQFLTYSNLSNSELSNATVYKVTGIASSNAYTHSEGYATTAVGVAAHAEGRGTISAAHGAHSEGRETVANGNYSHASGYKTQASKTYSSTEGVQTMSLADGAHVEGNGNKDVLESASAGRGYESQFYITANAAATTFTTTDSSGNALAHNLVVGSLIYYLDTAASSPTWMLTYVISVPSTTSFSTRAKLSDSAITRKKVFLPLGAGGGNYSHVEGALCTTAYHYGHAEGFFNKTSNIYEHAEGSCNVTHYASAAFGNAKNTIHSIGIGSFNNTTGVRTGKNAVEVMQNGDVFVLGIGGYDGKTIEGKDTLQSIIGAAAMDANVVHKSGSENIAGNKTFTGNVLVRDNSLTMATDSQSKYPINISVEPYYDDGAEGVGVLGFDDGVDGNVILRYLHDPIESYDAATKNYVDNIVGDIETLLAAI